MIDGVDCSTPHDGAYPSWAQVVLGYEGGKTPYIWSTTDVQNVRDTGRVWVAIRTAPNASDAPTLTAQQGHLDGANMLAHLPDYGYDKTLAIMYDIEPNIFDRDPVGARACIDAWKQTMRGGGYTQPYSYTVERQGGDWIANPTGIRPSSIPPGKIGVQYGQSNEKPNPFFDFNVFDPAILGGNMSVNGPENWDNNDWAAFRAQFPALQNYDPTHPDNPSVATVAHYLLAMRDGDAGHNDLGDIRADIAALKQLILNTPALSGNVQFTGTATIQ